MFKVFRKEMDWGGKKLVLETGRIARQADGAVLASLGDTTVLCTVVGAHKPKPGQDFFPLTVNYQEKTFAAGKIPGGYFKREGRPTEKETLVSRLIDRPIRPLFPRRLSLRHAGDCDCPQPRSGKRSRYCRLGRLLGSANDFRYPVPRPDRRRPRWL